MRKIIQAQERKRANRNDVDAREEVTLQGRGEVPSFETGGSGCGLPLNCSVKGRAGGMTGVPAKTFPFAEVRVRS